MRELVASCTFVVLPILVKSTADCLCKALAKSLHPQSNSRKVLGFGRLSNELSNRRRHEVFWATRVRADDRRLACHTLHEHQSERLLERRKAAKLRDGVHLRKLVLSACPNEESIFQSEFSAQVREFFHFFIWASANAKACTIRVFLLYLCHGMKKCCLALPFRSFAHEHDNFLVFCKVRLGSRGSRPMDLPCLFPH